MDDGIFLQKLIDAGGNIAFPEINPATGKNVYDIREPLVLRSGSHVTLDGCILRLSDRVYSNIFISEGAWEENPAPVNDISIRAVKGGRLDGGNPNGLNERSANKDGKPSIMRNTFILLRNVHNFNLTGLKLAALRYWGITLYYCSGGVIDAIEFEAANNVPNQDGIDLRRGCHDIAITNVTGSTGDDTVALTALMHGFELNFTVEGMPHDIYNVTIRNISTEVTGGHSIVRLLCHDGIRMHSIEVSNIYDRLIDTRLAKCRSAVRIGDANYWSVKPAQAGDMYDITVSGVTTNAAEAVRIDHSVDGAGFFRISTIIKVN